MKRIFISSVQKEFAYERKLLKRYISRNPAYKRLFDTFVFEEDPAVLYSQEAARAGVYEAILYRTPGQSGCGGDVCGGMPTRVTECAHSNVHIINQKGEFQTAPLDNLILPGIARAHLITACHALGIPVSETPFTVDEMMNAKEVLISSSSAPGLRCVEIDGKPVGKQAPETVAALQKWVKDEIFAATEPD